MVTTFRWTAALVRAAYKLLLLLLSPFRLTVWRAWAHWLHTRWPAGRAEKLPLVNPDGTTNVPGLYVTGDLTGVPLLKLAADSGARAIQHMLKDRAFRRQSGDPEAELYDLVIVGAGVSGMAAALEARRAGLKFLLLENSAPFSTIVNFPARKPIYTYPSGMQPRGELEISAGVKEELLEELRRQTVEAGIEVQEAMVEKVLRKGAVLECVVRNREPILSRRVVVAIGRSGNFRRLGVPGEDLTHVANRLYDPKDYQGKQVLVVGGGDSALESAIAIAECGGAVHLCYRKQEFSRPKPENIKAVERLQKNPRRRTPDTSPQDDRVTVARGSYMHRHHEAGSLQVHLGTQVERITAGRVALQGKDGPAEIEADAVLTMIGREPPLDFFRRSGVKIKGETRGLEWIGITLFFLAIWFIYDWKNAGMLTNSIDVVRANTFPSQAPEGLVEAGRAVLSDQPSVTGESPADRWQRKIEDRSKVLGTLAVSMQGRSFYFTLLYTLVIGWFGLRRIFRRRTPYVTLQTSVLFLVQAIPLFLLPELVLPWMGYNGYFEQGFGQTFANSFFELYGGMTDQSMPEGSHPRAYWRAYGFILAFPLMVYNLLVNSSQSFEPWLWLSLIQTFVLIPLIVWKWGKGAFCGWICSCGGLAETLGDAHREKMPHGPGPNRLNMLGQVILLLAFALLALRLWIAYAPGTAPISQKLLDHWVQGSTASYLWMVDVLLGGILGVGLYFKFSGRLWCRFACPLAALMHVYARFSRFRILAEKSRCISCNVCTSVCHMGIDVMNFANKGMPMEDPQCVRCSACVASCPTGVLEFGEVDGKGDRHKGAWLSASAVRATEQASAEPNPQTQP